MPLSKAQHIVRMRIKFIHAKKSFQLDIAMCLEFFHWPRSKSQNYPDRDRNWVNIVFKYNRLFKFLQVEGETLDCVNNYVRDLIALM